jgi:hypothetical protein
MRTCTICSHPELEEINKQLLNSGSYRDIAGQFGTSKSTLERHHKGGHIPEAMTKAQGAKEEARADKLLDDLKSVRSKTEALLKKAEDAGEIKAWPAFLRELREQIRLWAELEGKIKGQQINVSIDIYNSPQWLEVGRALAEILEPESPELRQKIAARLYLLAEAHK